MEMAAPVGACLQMPAQDPIFAALGLQQVVSVAVSKPPPPPMTMPPPLHNHVSLPCPPYAAAYPPPDWYMYTVVDVGSPVAAEHVLGVEKDLTSSPSPDAPLLLPDVLPAERPATTGSVSGGIVQLAPPPPPPLPAPTSPSSAQQWPNPPSWSAPEVKDVVLQIEGGDSTATPIGIASSPATEVTPVVEATPESCSRSTPVELNLAERFVEAVSPDANKEESNWPKGTIAQLFGATPSPSPPTPSGFRADAPEFVPQPGVPVLNSWTCLATSPHHQGGPVIGFLAAGLGLADVPRIESRPSAFVESRQLFLQFRTRVLMEESESPQVDQQTRLRAIAIDAMQTSSDIYVNSGDSCASTDEQEESSSDIKVRTVQVPRYSGKAAGKGKSESRSMIKASAVAARAMQTESDGRAAGEEILAALTAGVTSSGGRRRRFGNRARG